MRDGGAFHVVWGEGDKLGGARIVTREPKWTLVEDGMHGNHGVRCESCAEGRGLASRLWIGTTDSKDSSLDKIFEIEWVRERLSMLNRGVVQVWPKTEVQSFQVDKLKWNGRIFQSSFSQEPTHEIMTVATKLDCAAIYGLLIEGNATQISIDRLKELASVIGIERYTPPLKPSPDFPSSDLVAKQWRRWIDEQLRSGVLNQGK